MDDVTINSLKKGDSPFEDPETQVIVGGVVAGSQTDGAVARVLSGGDALGEQPLLGESSLDGQAMANDLFETGGETVSDVSDALVEPAETLSDPTSFFEPEGGAAAEAIDQYSPLSAVSDDLSLDDFASMPDMDDGLPDDLA